MCAVVVRKDNIITSQTHICNDIIRMAFHLLANLSRLIIVISECLMIIFLKNSSTGSAVLHRGRSGFVSTAAHNNIMHRHCKLKPMCGVDAYYTVYTHGYTTRQIRYFWKRKKYDSTNFQMDFESVQYIYIYIGSLYRIECKICNFTEFLLHTHVKGRCHV